MILQVVSGTPFVTLLRPTVVGRRHFGVPPGGPFDRRSAQIATGLVQESAEVYEAAIAPCSFRALRSGAVAVFGGNDSVRLNGEPRPSAGAFAVRQGDLLEVGPAVRGLRTYIAASPHDEVFLSELAPELPPRDILQAVVAEHEVSAALGWEWTVTVNLDRRGIRLDSGFHTQARQRASEMTVPGTIQITPDGTAILLGPDGPTIGGYPVAGVVIDADLDLTGQLMPGERVRFQPVSVAEALSVRRTLSDP